MDGKVTVGGITILLIAIIVLIAPAVGPAFQRSAPVFEELGESFRASMYDLATTGHVYDTDHIIISEAELMSTYGAQITLPLPSDHSIQKHGTVATALIKECIEQMGAQITMERIDPTDGLKRTYSICRLPDGRFGVSIDLMEVGRNVSRYIMRYTIAKDVIRHLGNGGATLVSNLLGGD